MAVRGRKPKTSGIPTKSQSKSHFFLRTTTTKLPNGLRIPNKYDGRWFQLTFESAGPRIFCCSSSTSSMSTLQHGTDLGRRWPAIGSILLIVHSIILVFRFGIPTSKQYPSGIRNRHPNFDVLFRRRTWSLNVSFSSQGMESDLTFVLPSLLAYESSLNQGLLPFLIFGV